MLDNECRLLLVEDNEVSVAVVQSMLKDVETPVFKISRAASLVSALDLLVQQKFDVALVDLNLPDSNGLETFLSIQRHAPGVAIIVLSACDNTTIAVQAMTLGAQDYLPKSELSANELIRALRYGMIRSRKGTDTPAARPAADVIGVIGSKGGVGTSTVACHMARDLKRQTGKDVLLCGLDPNSAGVAYFMKVQSHYTISDVSLNLHRLDVALWKNMVVSTPDQIDVLPPAGAADEAGVLDKERLQHVLRFARTMYQYVVIDLGQSSALSLGMLGDMTALYVVSTQDLVALWEAGRLLKALCARGLAKEHIRFVVNQHKRHGLSADELERAFGHKVEGMIGDAAEEQYELFAQGRFVEVKSQVHKDTSRLVSKLLGKEERAESKSLLGRLIAR